MKSILAETIDMVVEEVLCNGDTIIKIDGTELPTQVAGCWEVNKNGEEVIGIYLYVDGKEIFKIQDVGTVVLNSVV